MTTPISATRVPVPPITRHCSILFRGGAQPIDIPGWPAARFLVVNQWNRDRNGLDVLTTDPDEARRTDKLLVPKPITKPSQHMDLSPPLVILDCEDDHDPWNPAIFATMERERASIAAKFPHVVVVPYLGLAREVLWGRGPRVDQVNRNILIREFIKPFAGLAPCLYFDPGDDGDPSIQLRMMRVWRKFAPAMPLYPVVWHYNKVARRICTPAEWKCQLDACVGPNVKGVVWWGEADGNNHMGMDSDPRTLAAFVETLKGTP